MRPYNEIYTRRIDWTKFAWEVVGSAAFVIAIGGLMLVLGLA